MLPHQIKPLWGIKLSPTADKEDFSEYYNERGDGKDAAKQLWQMLRK